MARTNDRKLGLKLETLEGRNLQSGLVGATNVALVPTVVPNPAIYAPNSPQLKVDLGLHKYHGVTGFFGQ